MIAKKRFLPILMSILMVFAMMPMSAGTASADAGDPAMVVGSDALAKNAKKNDAQTLWYAGNAWRVIDYGEGTMRLLAADNLMDPVVFSDEANDYIDSNIKSILDGLYADRFSKGEKSAVIERTLEVGENTNSWPYSTGVSGTATSGHLWPLSISEALELDTSESKELLKASSFWWLRSPGSSDSYGDHVSFVSGAGDVKIIGVFYFDHCGVRPAFDLNLNSVLFTSAAESGKSSGAKGVDALKAQSDQVNSGNEWKVTVPDNAHSGFAVSNVTATEKGVSVTYTGAATGTNEYVSAIITDKPITDESAKITYYGRVKSCAAASDTVMINTAGKLKSGDTLYVFNEKYNGDKKTDYASALQKVTIPKLAPVTKVSGTLLSKITAKGKSSLVLTWSKIKGAEGYDIFFAKCGKNDKNALKKVKTIKGNKTFKWTKKRLKTKKPYKAVVKAYVTKNGKKTYVRTSPMVHAYTSGGTSKYTNAKRVTVKKASVSLKAGKTYKIKANVVKLQKGKKLVPTSHAPKLRYVSSNKKIATVSKSGKITAKSKGSCKIYVIAVNGASKAVSVTVK